MLLILKAIKTKIILRYVKSDDHHFSSVQQRVHFFVFSPLAWVLALRAQRTPSC